MATETHYFRSTVRQYNFRSSALHLMLNPSLSSHDMHEYLFNLCKVTGHCWQVEAPGSVVYGPPNLITPAQSFVFLPSVKLFPFKYRKIMAQKLFSIRVPLEDQATIIEEIFEAVHELAVSGVRIVVCVWDVTVRFLDSASNLGLEDVTRDLWITQLFAEEDNRFTMESMETYVPRFIPAAKSCIDGLEKVRFDSLEDKVRQTPCAICREGLDHFAAEQGTDGQLMITRLPCLHVYHEDCIVQSLKRNHLCPLCRYPMSTASRPRHWDCSCVLVRGMLTAATCAGLLINLVKR